MWWGGGGCGVVELSCRPYSAGEFNTLFLTTFRTYNIASPPQTNTPVKTTFRNWCPWSMVDTCERRGITCQWWRRGTPLSTSRKSRMVGALSSTQHLLTRGLAIWMDVILPVSRNPKRFFVKVQTLEKLKNDLKQQKSEQ